jgi:hypothetical protein
MRPLLAPGRACSKSHGLTQLAVSGTGEGLGQYIGEVVLRRYMRYAHQASANIVRDSVERDIDVTDVRERLVSVFRILDSRRVVAHDLHRESYTLAELHHHVA